ncbi:hypothetical protein T440DRAFT_31062 [Plenodomus tracheiphilus IPT5]|uniref:Uncharacterized protein n=1 Tax=Plenodomus tracheiphilus IPT5 TaxID=1408161 RepID=A0A6A7BBE2_9PLEO|nr:hypothetical protein T440DRAFT_31062 [Plenodomus tracheiphilus IPT5]
MTKLIKLEASHGEDDRNEARAAAAVGLTSAGPRSNDTTRSPRSPHDRETFHLAPTESHLTRRSNAPPALHATRPSTCRSLPCAAAERLCQAIVRLAASCSRTTPAAESPRTGTSAAVSHAASNGLGALGGARMSRIGRLRSLGLRCRVR